VQWLAALWLAVTTATGASTFEVRPRLVIEHRRTTPAPHGTIEGRAPDEWVIVESPRARSAGARRVGPTYRADVTLEWRADEPGVDVRVDLTYLAPVRVVREALELTLPADAVAAVYRDGELREVPRTGSLHIDRWTPRLCQVRRGGGALLVDGRGVEGMEVRRAGRAVTVRLELDDVLNHPFRVEPRCRTRWRSVGRPVDESARRRREGEQVTYRARLIPGGVPLLLDRLPEGRRAVVVFSDHADQTTLTSLRALLYGTSDEQDPRFGRGGFLGHGLPLTKAFFRRGEVGRPQLEDPRVFALAEKLLSSGGEIALHSATPAPDPRPVTEEALAFVKPLRVETWIDHQPPTNCEAFTDRGWRPGDPYAIGDLLETAGIRTVWAAGKEPQDDINLLRPREAGAHVPFLYPQAAPAPGAPAGLWLFRSVWAYVEEPRLFRLLAPERLDRLEAERGVAILHTYLEALRPERRLRRRNLMRPGARPDAVELDPRFDALLADLARRAAGGRLWVTTLRDLGAHLRAMAALEVRPAADGAITVRNPGPATLRGATFRLPRAGARLIAPGARAAVTREGGLALDLAPGAAVRLTARGPGGEQLPLAAPATVRFLGARPAPSGSRTAAAGFRTGSPPRGRKPAN
jgi:hypothetical protein